MSRVVEMRLDVFQSDNPDDAVLETERTGPVSIEITPEYQEVEGKRVLVFRVAFEPDNELRRKQPFRKNVAPTFPDGWKIGDPWPEKA